MEHLPLQSPWRRRYTDDEWSRALTHPLPQLFRKAVCVSSRTMTKPNPFVGEPTGRPLSSVCAAKRYAASNSEPKLGSLRVLSRHLHPGWGGPKNPAWSALFEHSEMWEETIQHELCRCAQIDKQRSRDGGSRASDCGMLPKSDSGERNGTAFVPPKRRRSRSSAQARFDR